MKAVAVIVGLLLAACAAGAGDSRPVVVELFTSQGSAKCPAADQLLFKLAERDDVIALTLPVTYWDMLGWKDSLAHEAHTARQLAYDATIGYGGIYTPQIVVDGTVTVVGNREGEIEAEISKAKGRAHLCGRAAQAPLRSCSIKVEIDRAAPGKLAIRIEDAPKSWRQDRVEATVWLIALRARAEVAVGGGENAGKTLHYRNVVDTMHIVGVWKGKAVSFVIPDRSEKMAYKDGLAVLLQLDGGRGRIVGAAYRGRPGGLTKP